MKEKFLYNNNILKDRRKVLRNQATEAEVILWKYLKHNKLSGFKFTRQYSVGPYILDFFCPKVRLAIELDGSQHGKEENVLYDTDRNSYLESVGIKTLRFWNYEVNHDTDTVLTQILNKARSLETPS